MKTVVTNLISESVHQEEKMLSLLHRKLIPKIQLRIPLYKIMWSNEDVKGMRQTGLITLL